MLLREMKLLSSSHPDQEDIVNNILKKKQFPNLANPQGKEAKILNTSIGLMIQFEALVSEVNNIAKTKFDSTDYNHEKKLLQLWNSFMPSQELDNRYSQQWVKLGFQGEDPATDFRGMGMLGLDNLLYLSTQYPQLSQKILLDSQEPNFWYPLAIVGINITSYCMELLKDNLLKFHLFNYGVNLKEFNEFYCYCAYSFNEYWLQSQLTPFLNDKPFTVMDFEQAFRMFKDRLYYIIINYDSTHLSEIKLNDEEHKKFN